MKMKLIKGPYDLKKRKTIVTEYRRRGGKVWRVRNCVPKKRRLYKYRYIRKFRRDITGIGQKNLLVGLRKRLIKNQTVIENKEERLGKIVARIVARGKGKRRREYKLMEGMEGKRINKTNNMCRCKKYRRLKILKRVKRYNRGLDIGKIWRKERVVQKVKTIKLMNWFKEKMWMKVRNQAYYRNYKIKGKGKLSDKAKKRRIKILVSKYINERKEENIHKLGGEEEIWNTVKILLYRLNIWYNVQEVDHMISCGIICKNGKRVREGRKKIEKGEILHVCKGELKNFKKFIKIRIRKFRKKEVKIHRRKGVWLNKKSLSIYVMGEDKKGSGLAIRKIMKTQEEGRRKKIEYKEGAVKRMRIARRTWERERLKKLCYRLTMRLDINVIKKYNSLLKKLKKKVYLTMKERKGLEEIMDGEGVDDGTIFKILKNRRKSMYKRESNKYLKRRRIGRKGKEKEEKIRLWYKGLKFKRMWVAAYSKLKKRRAVKYNKRMGIYIYGLKNKIKYREKKYVYKSKRKEKRREEEKESVCKRIKKKERSILSKLRKKKRYKRLKKEEKGEKDWEVWEQKKVIGKKQKDRVVRGKFIIGNKDRGVEKRKDGIESLLLGSRSRNNIIEESYERKRKGKGGIKKKERGEGKKEERQLRSKILYKLREEGCKCGRKKKGKCLYNNIKIYKRLNTIGIKNYMKKK